MLDIDNFKTVNNMFGHLVGDIVLKEIASLISHDNRNEDFSARFSAKKFVIVLDGCSAEAAKIKAENFRKMIEELNPSDIKVTASFGICELSQKHIDFEALIRDVDMALYAAKESGRNCIILVKDGELIA